MGGIFRPSYIFVPVVKFTLMKKINLVIFSNLHKVFYNVLDNNGEIVLLPFPKSRQRSTRSSDPTRPWKQSWELCEPQGILQLGRGSGTAAGHRHCKVCGQHKHVPY